MFDILCEIFPDEIFDYMVTETNRNARQFLAKIELKPSLKYRQWFLASRDETLYCFEAFNENYSGDYVVTPIFLVVTK